MPYDEFDYEDLTKTLTDNFNILADEVQLLSDRKTILEHKLRFAHEQYQHLADKYAPGDAEISGTLAKLQLPPDPQTPDRAGFVPLPPRGQTQSKQQTAVAIRDGRRAAQRMLQLAGRSFGSTTSKSISGSSLRHSVHRTSLSTVLEQDFTVQGKKGSLHCPFSPPTNGRRPSMKPQASQGSDTLDSDRPLTPSDARDAAHPPDDPICAAMYIESSAPPSANGSAAKCPIRFLDQHSPEEVTAYFETHKHEIPRSHEVCVRRYQRNENDIRKLDAKYGSLVNMIQGLGQMHQPMLPAKEEQDSVDIDIDRTSNERVENWAHAVSADGVDPSEEKQDGPVVDEEDRESRFDRPLKEVRVGESPSRPWGISVPIFDPPERPVSPPPAPVSTEHLPKPAGKCPFGHGQASEEEIKPVLQQPFERPSERPSGKCPFGHGQAIKSEEQPVLPPVADVPAAKCPVAHNTKLTEEIAPKATVQPQPTFIQPAELARSGAAMPQMIFTGPVFIGYPMDQAIAFMQQYKGTQ